MSIPKFELELRAYTKKEIAAMYKFTTRSLTRQMKPIQDIVGKREGNYYNVHQSLVIFKHLGIPCSWNGENNS